MNEKGISLMEVVVSITILSIIILLFSNIFLFTNNAANMNNEKIVAVHLAKATLESVKTDPTLYFNITSTTITPAEGYEFDANNTVTIPQLINDKNYDIKVKANQTNNQKKLGLIHIIVEVKLQNSKTPISSIVEGFVDYEQ